MSKTTVNLWLEKQALSIHWFSPNACEKRLLWLGSPRYRASIQDIVIGGLSRKQGTRKDSQFFLVFAAAPATFGINLINASPSIKQIFSWIGLFAVALDGNIGREMCAFKKNA